MTAKDTLHKSKSVLTTIIGYSDMVKASLVKADVNGFKKEIRYLDQIKKNALELNESIIEAQSRIE